ncbi:MAG: LysR family transcriptional regulator [Sakamotonia sp.]|jgi:DNA-binding transcriptional LysR family regulator
MTIQQLQYVLEIARCGSASRAAKNLFLSQPNLSSAIKNLEQELGFPIFERTSAGMKLTPAGARLAKEASVIMEHLKGISDSEKNAGSACRFRLIYPMYDPAFEAFRDLCRDYQGYDKMNLSCASGTGVKMLELLHQDLCDLVVTIDTRGHYTDFNRYCNLFHLEYRDVAEASFSVQLSKDHPLLKEAPFDFAKLKNYPYVAYTDGTDGNLNWTPWSSVVNPDKLIRVQSIASRAALVASTNAFSLVFPHSRAYNEANGVVTVPLPFDPLILGYIYSRDRGLGEAGEAYVRHLKERIREHFGEDGWKNRENMETDKNNAKNREKTLAFSSTICYDNYL